MFVFDIKNPFSHDIAAVGGKAYGLFRLIEYGFRVPEFFVITANTDIDSEDFDQELRESASKLHCANFAVRSSGAAEDGASASYAGQYDTVCGVNVRGLADAVRKVARSARCKNVEVYTKSKKNTDSNIAVIVQRQILASEAGVLFSSSPQDANTVLIERVRGAGENLVSGKSIPELLRYEKRENASGYEGELLRAAHYLEQKENNPVDVEWAYDGELWFLQLRHQTVLYDEIPPVRKRDWHIYVYRDFSVLCHSVQVLASQEQIQRELFGFSVPISEGLLVCGREFYSSQNDAAVYKIWEQADRGDFFDTYVDKIEKLVRATRRRCARVRTRDYASLSDRSLFDSYRREIEYYTQSYVPMMMRPDDYLYARLIDCVGEKKAREISEAVKSLLPPTYYSSERSAFLHAVACGDSQAYLDRYEWQNNPLGKKILPVTESEFSRRAQGITPDKAQEMIDFISAEKQKARVAAKRVLRNVEGEQRRLSELILRFTYYRTRIAENSDRYFYFIRKYLLGEICRRTGLDDETIVLYRADEVPKIAMGEFLPVEELIKRKNGEAIIFDGKSAKTYFGASAFTLLKTLLPEPNLQGNIRGEVACVGEAEGTVKVVRNFADAEQVQKGSIVVTSMTTPDIVFALEKAVGIITDEGGITCHASIIAREYAVPCLVGTQIATRVLKDGMRVKIDCINGYFEVLD